MATYRLQLHAGFTFDDVRAVLPYLAELGISDVYLSPITQAMAGSLHGYDAIDPTQLNEELGGEPAFRALVEELHRLDMGLLLDIVPNHLGIADGKNSWWEDVLRRGRESPHAPVFDIDWDVPDPAVRGKVLLPILGDTLEAVLARGELTVEGAGDDAHLVYFDRRLPLAPGSLEAGVADTIAAAPPSSAARERLARLLEAQHYRLDFWREGKPWINYRRFFEIDTLAGIREEDPQVFDRVHALILRLVREGAVTGLRIDHPDGLADPAAYLARLREETGGAYAVVEKILATGEELPADWAAHGTTGYDFLNDVSGAFVAREHADQLTRIYRGFTGRTLAYEEIAYATRRDVIEGPLRGRFTVNIERLARAVPEAERAGVEAFGEALRTLVACMPVYRTYHTRDALDPEGPRRLAEAAREARARNPAVEAEALHLAESLLAEPPAGPAREPLLALQQLMPAVAAKGLEDTAFYRYLRLLSLNAVGGEPAQFGSSLAEFHQRNEARRARWPASLLATATHDHKRGEDVRARLNVLSELPDEWTEALERLSALSEGLRRPTAAGGPDRRDEYLVYQTLLGIWPSGLAAANASPELSERLQAYVLKAAREAGQRTDWIDQDADYEAGLAGFVAGLFAPGAGRTFLEECERLAGRVARFGTVNSLSQLLMRLTAPGVPDTYQGTELWDLTLVDPDNRRPVDYASRHQLLRRLHPLLEDGQDADALRAARIPELLAAHGSGEIKLYVLARTLGRRHALRTLFVDGNYVPLFVVGERARHVIAYARVLGRRVAIAVATRLSSSLLPARAGARFWEPDWSDTELELPDDIEANSYLDVLAGAHLVVHSVEGRRRLRLGEVLRRLPVALLEARSDVGS